jgi:hypothetical protein
MREEREGERRERERGRTILVVGTALYSLFTRKEGDLCKNERNGKQLVSFIFEITEPDFYEIWYVL